MRTLVISSIAALSYAQNLGDDLLGGVLDAVTPNGFDINVSFNGMTSTMALGENLSSSVMANGDTQQDVEIWATWYTGGTMQQDGTWYSTYA